MAVDNDLSFKKWNIVREQLICLKAFYKVTKINDDLSKILTENVPLKNINSQILISICYFLLGIIDTGERDKLIKWPLINIQTQTKFRKGLSTMIANFQEKYPWAHVEKLPESYLISPHGYQKKVLDFLSRLTNLAIHITLDGSALMIMHSGNGLNDRDIEIMQNVISKATQQEEKLIKENAFSINEFETIKNEISDKCVALRQENNELDQNLNSLIKCAISEGLICSEKNAIEEIRMIRDKKVADLNKINSELKKYSSASQKLASKLKALKNPVSLCAGDFNCEKSLSKLSQSTLRVCEDAHKLSQKIISMSNITDQEESFYEQLKLATSALKAENEALKSFLAKAYPFVH